MMTALWQRLYWWVLSKIRRALPRTNRPFVVLSSGRSGSSFLVQFLNCHNRITCLGELLNRELLEDQGLIGASENYLIDYVSGSLLSFNFWRPCTGFKLFNEQLEYCKLSLGVFLGRLQYPSVIVLYRENLLETFVSLKIAFQNNIWYSESTVNDTRIEVVWEEFYRYTVTERTRWKHSMSQIPPLCNLLLVSYEEMTRNQTSATKDIFSFLGLIPYSCTATSKRQNPLPLNEKVINYDEIMEKITEHKLSICLTENWLKAFVT